MATGHSGSASALYGVAVDRRQGNLEPRVRMMLGPERKAQPSTAVVASKSSVLGAMLRQAESAASTRATSELDAATASKKALAADLEGMIEGMLRTTQFATAATSKTRSWSRSIGELAALDASTEDTAFTASSLVADLAQARPVAATPDMRSAAPHRWWIDAVLVLACLLSVVSAGYFTFAL